MFKREDFIIVEIKDGGVLRAPYPEELDQMVEAAEAAAKRLIEGVNHIQASENYEKEKPK